MKKFKVGDKVECITSHYRKLFGDDAPIEFFLYTISGYDNIYPQLKEFDYLKRENLWDDNCFILSKAAPKKKKSINYTEQQLFKALMKKMGISINKFTDKQYFFEEALEAGAVISYDICDGQTTFNFNKKGRFVGINNQSIDGWKKRNK